MRDARAGQSIVEYLLLVTMILVAVVAGVGLMRPGVNQVYQESANKASQAAAALGALTIP